MNEQMTAADAQRALDEIARHRRAFARRLRLPGWYLAPYVLATVALFVDPALTVRPHHHLPWSAVPIVIVAATVVLSLSGLALRQASGARLPTDTARVYPSTRRVSLVALAIVVLGSAATWTAAASLSWPASLACGLTCAGLLVVAQQRTLAAIRRDISTGRAGER